jgi:hypothetical protein
MSDRAVRFVRSLALASASSVAAVVSACGGGQAPATSPASTTAAPSASASSLQSTQVTTDESPQSMPNDGPCRCSWDTNAQAAPRVCKRGEPNYEGTACVAGGGPSYYGNKKYPMPVPGPLPPPELRARRGRAKPRSR